MLHERRLDPLWSHRRHCSRQRNGQLSRPMKLFVAYQKTVGSTLRQFPPSLHAFVLIYSKRPTHSVAHTVKRVFGNLKIFRFGLLEKVPCKKCHRL